LIERGNVLTNRSASQGKIAQQVPTLARGRRAFGESRDGNVVEPIANSRIGEQDQELAYFRRRLRGNRRLADADMFRRLRRRRRTRHGQGEEEKRRARRNK
jgi:hypothetical protein